MRKVFSSTSEVCHVFAQRTQKEGKAGNVFFKDDVIYSYGHHFPIGAFIDYKDSSYLFVNDDSYSVSTSKHQREFWNATRQYNRLMVNTGFLEDVIKLQDAFTNPYYGKNDRADAVKIYKKELVKTASHKVECAVKSAAIAASKRRKVALIDYDIQSALSERNRYIKALGVFGLKLPAKTLKMCGILESDFKVIEKQNQKELEAEKRKREKAIKERAKQQAQAFELASAEFYEGVSLNRIKTPYGRDALYNANHALLRVNGDDVETSQGARFSIVDAQQSFQYPLYAKTHCKELTPQNATLGHYRIDKVLSNGDVKAGCHYVKWESIEKCAKELGLL